MKSLISLATAVVLLASATGALADAASNGKTTAHLTASGIPLGPIEAPMGQVTIAKGLKKRILQAEVVVVANVFADSLAATLDVNGVTVEPDPANIQRLTICNPSYINCTHAARFWADLDALEAASPGTFINQPLVITAHASTGTGSGNGNVTIRSRLVKK